MRKYGNWLAARGRTPENERGVRHRKEGAVRRRVGRQGYPGEEAAPVQRDKERKSRENTCPARFFSSRGVSVPSSLRRIRLKLNAPTWTSCRFRMFSRPRRWPAPHAIPSRSSARSCVRLTRRAVAVRSCRTLPAPVAGSNIPPAARHAGLASRAVLSASSPVCNCALCNSSSARPPHYCGSPYLSPVLRSPANGPYGLS
jgi:hypothetical protein